MTGLDDEDRELDEFLARRSVLHRRLADRDYHEPSQELDRLVLDQAREAIDVPSSTRLYRAPRWALPVTLAASFVLGLAVVMNFARMRGPQYPVAASASPPAEAAPGFAADTKARPMAPPALQTQLAKQGSEAFAPEPRTDSADAESLRLKAANARAGAENPTSTAETNRAADELLASNAPVSAPLSASREAKITTSGAAAKSPPNAAAVQMPSEVHAASDAGAIASTSAANAQLASSPASVSSSARFARAEVENEGRVVPARDRALRQAESAAPAPAAASEKADHTDPQIWMRQIEQLRLAGKSADADREIAAFRKAFPSLPISPAALGRDPRPTK